MRSVLWLAPGVVVHELAHALLCRACGVPVRRAVYFRTGAPAGFVTHAEPPLLRQTLLIIAGPLLVNSLVALAALLVSARALAAGSPLWGAASLLLLWPAGSIAVQAWPSATDARNLLRAALQQCRRLNPLAPLALLPAALCLLVDRLRPLGVGWLYLALLAALAARLGGLWR